MKHSLVLTAAAFLMATGAHAETIGVAMANSENFLNIVRDAMATEAATRDGVEVQYLDANNDVLTQVDQVKNLLARDVDALIVNPVDSSYSTQIIAMARAAETPLVFVNRAPVETDLPEGVAYVGSDENTSGAMQIDEIARILGDTGNVAILQGDVATIPGILRTEKVEDFIATKPGMKVVLKDSANFLRTEAIDIVTTWLSMGVEIDAIAANNDEMAIGAIVALEQAGIDPKTIVIGGIDATPDAMEKMKEGTLALTVFQDAAGQGRGSMETALRMVAGEEVESNVWIPFQLVTRENMAKYMN